MNTCFDSVFLTEIFLNHHERYVIIFFKNSFLEGGVLSHLKAHAFSVVPAMLNVLLIFSLISSYSSFLMIICIFAITEERFCLC